MAKLTLFDNTNSALKASASASEKAALAERLGEKIAQLDDTSLQDAGEALLGHDKAKALLAFLEAHSPHLSHLTVQQARFLCLLARDGLDAGEAVLTEQMAVNAADFATKEAVMSHLRLIKNRGALMIGLADILGLWDVEQVTARLSDMAQGCLKLAADFLLLDALKRGELTHINKDTPSHHSGWIILGMGKLGARELNYSSDIDLIVLFDEEKVTYGGRHNIQHCFSRMTRDLVTLMQERTPDGYVFRTDIRLRPDPASTPPAVSANGALSYYESVGQNWERAAMIKARAVAGDIEAGEAFLAALTPFIWRRYLDFAAIADIHSIKRQIDHRVKSTAKLAGHNLKLGLGGIREIEFYVQVQQLIWGGRHPHLRERQTCATLDDLAEDDIIDPQAAIDLKESYAFLRKMEHRVQMQRDHQAHSLPEQEEELKRFALFAGFETYEQFEKETRHHLRRVRDHYTKLYGVEKSLGSEGNLVFTGVDADPETQRTLGRMGFTQTETIIALIADWHRGKRRATRNKRARELLTELTPQLLAAFGKTVHPDTAFLKFDDFLDRLPGGVQIFSLFDANNELLRLIATIMGSAPRLADILSRNPYLMDGTLTGTFLSDLPHRDELEENLNNLLQARGHYEDFVNTLGQFKQEYEFQAGIHLMEKITSPDAVAHFLTILAEVVLNAALEHVKQEFAQSYGTIKGADLAVVAMGKLGAYELTFASDLDLIFVYSAPDPEAASDGKRSFTASVYYNRLCQRFVGLLTSVNREGRLFEVDTRLRPSGTDGPLAASLEAFNTYFDEAAWTFELMALTRARPISGGEALQAKLTDGIHHHLIHPRDTARLREDVDTMRQKVAAEFGTQNPWDVKQVRGGMMDVDFISQYLQLRYAPQHGSCLRPSSRDALQSMERIGLLPGKQSEQLLEAYGRYTHLLHLLRLCNHGKLDEATAPQGLKYLLSQQFDLPDFETLKTQLIKTEESVYGVYQDLLRTKESEA